MQLLPFPQDAVLPEHQRPDKPVIEIESRMEGYLGTVVPWHWHEHAQLLFVRDGQVTVAAPGLEVTLEAGQGCFISCAALHRASCPEDATARVAVLLFDPEAVIAGRDESLVSRYLSPILQSRSLTLVPLTGGEPWQRSVLSNIKAAAAACSGQAPGWEFAVRSNLTDIWMAMLQLLETWSQPATRGIRERRLRTILRYLQDHYAENMRLDEAATASGISGRECTRCFHDLLDMTPIEYLTILRVRVAALELERGHGSLAKVGMDAGFSSSSYFGKVFRQYTGQTPRAYRRLTQPAQESRRRRRD